PVRAAGDAVDPRRPFDLDVLDWLVVRGNQGEQPFAFAALQLLDQDAAVGEAEHAKLADQLRRHRPMDVVVEHDPSVEHGAQALAADPARDRAGGGPFWRHDFVEVALFYIVEVRG